MFRFIDLFAGLGGFHHALSGPNFGGECVFASDIDPQCRLVYQSTWPDLPDERLVGDIRELTLEHDGADRSLEELDRLIPDHEVLCAGFPCQPFSKSGTQQGTLDSTRGTLFFDILRIVQAKTPEFLLLENVRNLAGPRHTETWTTIVESLRAEGYRLSEVPIILSPHLLPPEQGGTPQTRDRVFILARRARPHESLESAPLFVRSAVDNWDPQDWRIEDFLDADENIKNLASYQLREDEVAWIDAWNFFAQNVLDETLPGFPLWQDDFQLNPVIPRSAPDWKRDFLRKNAQFYKQHRLFINKWRKMSWIPGRDYKVGDFPASRRKFEWQARDAQPSAAERDLWQLTLHFRPSGIRVRPATYLPALVAIAQTSIIGSRRRRITPREASRLQGLPDWLFEQSGVDDATAYRQLGNGVHVGAVRYLARILFEDGGKTWGKFDGQLRTSLKSGVQLEL